jgi:hypothetical protein
LLLLLFLLFLLFLLLLLLLLLLPTLGLLRRYSQPLLLPLPHSFRSRMQSLHRKMKFTVENRNRRRTLAHAGRERV